MPTVKVTATGRAAHAGNHHKEGANAIWALSLFISKVATQNGVEFLSIEGGTSRNTVPDRAVVTMRCPDAVLASLDLTSEIEGTTLTMG